MIDYTQLTQYLGGSARVVRTIVVVAVLAILVSLLISFVRHNLLRLAKTKKQISNIKIFSKILKYVSIAIILIIAVISYSGTLGDLGLTVGLMSAALGWALQRPITGIAGWIFVVMKRPFEIGDIVILAGVKGSVTDITLTHIYLDEIGGISSSEEKSGRTILIPNSILFEQNITNYTRTDETTLDEVVVTVTFKSDLDKAVELAESSAKKVLGDLQLPQKYYSRTYFQQNGINIHLRMFVPAIRRQEVTSLVTQEVFRQIKKNKKVELAYLQNRVILGSKTQD